ncbi:hypothetical protein HDV63DRAFT_408522 [Trichoderma sp. SZMC 28014]
MAEATHDVISISSSDDDSDCQIVKVSRSLGGRTKSKMRWQYQPYKLPRCRRSKKMIRQLYEDDEDDFQDTEPMSNQNKPSFEPGVTAVSGDATRNGRSQSMDQSIDSLRFDSMADHSSFKEMSDAKTERSAAMRVDPTDPLANRHHTADLEPTSMLPPPFPSQIRDPSNQISARDNEGKRRESRSRSCSVATLDFPLEMADARRKDVQGLDSDVLDVQRELLLGGPTNLEQTLAKSAVVPKEDGSILVRGSDQAAIKTEEHQDVEAAIKAEQNQDVEANSLRLFKSACTMSRGRLPRVGKRTAWSSMINFAGYETLLGPFFTQRKETIRSVTYDDMVEERAGMNKKKG